ncbi:N-acetyltransferase [Conexibacter stalactiti]|uniref:N-acetyltransferase n=1 Tax=Conexibacter stalactiti TaxID=1940611 RepID=A0ABU4HRZ9_9ACTN|nr:N-acetyltransferase [Conexibacter stalactiti]MDW5595462.1 N-acetyltransferase [Conexibacter stalactiti]MEC5036104.1 N-acetyltransferase [Conexibacter stalactiti]
MPARAADITIRPCRSDDADALWAILQAVFSAGETYAYPTDISREAALAGWTAPPARAWVAERDGVVVGSSRVMPNQPGQGAHVANGSFVVAPDAGGRGVGRALCEHALQAAAELGYRAMQFNLVVSANERAVALWRSLGFETVGRLPGAFMLHGEEVDAFVMYRRLDDLRGG